MSAIGSAVQVVGPFLPGLLYLHVANFAPYLPAVVILVAAALLVRRRSFTEASPERGRKAIAPAA